LAIDGLTIDDWNRQSIRQSAIRRSAFGNPSIGIRQSVDRHSAIRRSAFGNQQSVDRQSAIGSLQ
jgi:hypothetical protein